MNRIFRLALVIVLVLASVTGCKKNSDDDNFQQAPANPDEQQLLNLVNNYRRSGCNCGGEYFPSTSAVTWNNTIEDAARDHSNDMNSNNFFDHQGSDGSDAGDRLEKRGYSWSSYGENIAKGQTTAEQVVDDWIKSPGHCRNIMDPDFKEMGIATSGAYWTQVFATQQ